MAVERCNIAMVWLSKNTNQSDGHDHHEMVLKIDSLPDISVESWRKKGGMNSKQYKEVK